jgi:hypothetical protein
MVGDFGKSTLKEFEPGLFFTNDNEALDLRTDKPTFRNILIQKNNTHYNIVSAHDGNARDPDHY